MAADEPLGARRIEPPLERGARLRQWRIEGK
jgi:hypothetical protein